MPVRIESLAEPIPGYKLIERIGGGGFGEVWKAEAPGGLHKAIKFVYGDLQTAGDDGARAEQELKALSRVKTVRHPYILSLERYDIIDGQLIIVMELADRNLWDRFKECRNDGLSGIPRDELLRYMEESAEALDLMNIEYQLQHLDIKPHNIFLTHNHIKVADFGLVKDLEGMVASVTGGVTPVYAAPETFDGYISRFCDQYSLAIVYQELLTGQRPFTGTNVRQLILQHLQAVPKLESLPACDRDAIAKALAKSPDERHRNCRELVAALRGKSGKLAVAPPQDGASGGANPLSDDSRVTMRPRAVRDALIQQHVSLQMPVEEPAPANDDLSPVEVTQRVRPSELVRNVPVEREAAAPAEEVPAPPVAELVPFEQTREGVGDGVLTPAVVIGLGQYGLNVLRRLRQEVQHRFGVEDASACLRLLYVDTDPDATRDAVRDAGGEPLAPGEIVLARLNRPSHYLKVRGVHDERPGIEGWFDKQMLYRITRTQQTGGVRALGRLAFCDNYTAIVRRLQEELASCAEPEQLTAADRATGLGIRRFRPRVYVIANLAGGTGSGMFLDMAYVARHLLRQSNPGEPEVVGLCFLPAVDRNPAHVMAVGNTFAALAELSYFSEPGNTFAARYQVKEAPLRDSSPPFTRCLMLPLRDESTLGEADPVACAGELLCRELFSPMGRAADQRRSELAQSRPACEPACQAFGMFRFAFPQRELVWQVARQLCSLLVERWISKDSKPVQATVQAWVQEQWSSSDLGVEALLDSVREGVQRLLGQSPEKLFADILQTLREYAGGNERAPAAIAPEMAIDALRAIDQLVGRPDQDALNASSGRIPEALNEASGVLVAKWGQQLTEMVLHLVEEPEYRLAGAEEAIRQLVDRIERALVQHEQISKELMARAAEARSRIHSLLRAMPTLPSARARAAASADLLSLLRDYPKWRNQHLLLQTVSRALLGVRGNMSDQLREINFCRVRLGELAQSFAADDWSIHARLMEEPPPFQPLEQVHPLLPAGCTTLEQAVEHFVRDVTPQDMNALDRQVQVMLVEQFRALFHVCMTSTNLLNNVRLAMEQEVARAAEQRIGATDVATLFLERFPSDEQAAGELASAFDAAAPDSPGSKSGPVSGEVCVLLAPATPGGERLKALAGQAVPDVPWVHARGGDEIIIYREAPQLAIADVPQFAPTAQEAYAQMTAVEHFTPHSRIDIVFAKGQEVGVRGQGSGVRKQGSGVRNQGSGVRNQGSGVRS
jgi:hypothetical protein